MMLMEVVLYLLVDYVWTVEDKVQLMDAQFYFSPV
jgi:hypothetical protein